MICQNLNFFRKAISCGYDPQIEIGVMKAPHKNGFYQPCLSLEWKRVWAYFGRKSRFIVATQQFPPDSLQKCIEIYKCSWLWN